MPFYTDEDGTVALIKPKPANRHGLHAVMAVATGGLWIVTGWVGQLLAKTAQIKYVGSNDDTRSADGLDGAGRLILLGLVVFLFAVLFHWLLVLTLGALLLLGLSAFLAIRLVRVARSWLTCPARFLDE